MNLEPQPLALQARAQAQSGAVGSLWRTAPGWRWTASAAIVFTGAAIVAPFMLASPQPAVAPAGSGSAEVPGATCAAILPPAPTTLRFQMVRPVGAEEAEAAVGMVERSIGARISPDFDKQRRVLLGDLTSGSGFSTTAVLPPGLTLSPGDIVEATSRYRDPNHDCSFIPWIVVRIIERAGAKP